MQKLVDKISSGQKVPFCLHEADLINYFIDKEKTIFRFGVAEFFINDDIPESKSKAWYIVDFYCENVSIVDLCWIGDAQYHGCEVLYFKYKDGIYSLWLEVCCSQFSHIEFKCENEKWIPVTVLSLDELSNIKSTEYFELDK